MEFWFTLRNSDLAKTWLTGSFTMALLSNPTLTPTLTFGSDFEQKRKHDKYIL